MSGAFLNPIRVPSLHVWGERDELTAPLARELADRFDAGLREIVEWPGKHVLPTRGPAFDAMVRFLAEQARRQLGGDCVTNV